MDEEKREFVQSWLTKALHDLESADGLAHLTRPRIDTAVYHCQQCAEKAIKGFLIFQNEIPLKIHLLGPLVTAAAQYDHRFALFSDAADLLTPLATEYRYPGSLQEPTRAGLTRRIRMPKRFTSMSSLFCLRTFIQPNNSDEPMPER